MREICSQKCLNRKFENSNRKFYWSFIEFTIPHLNTPISLFVSFLRRNDSEDSGNDEGRATFRKSNFQIPEDMKSKDQ